MAFMYICVKTDLVRIRQEKAYFQLIKNPTNL